MKRLILLRHGQSQWNLENRFTGWTDVGLSKHGKLEARKAGQILKAENYSFDVAYTSVLKRALVKYLENINDEDIVGLNIPTGIPLIYDLDDGLRLKNCHYLWNEYCQQTAHGQSI